MDSVQCIARYLASLAKDFTSSEREEENQIDHWLDCAQLISAAASQKDFDSFMSSLESSLGLNRSRKFLVANKLTIADFGVLAALKSKLSYFKN